MEHLILQLKQQPVFQEQPVLAVECTWDKLLSELDELLSQLDFGYFTYSVLTRNSVVASDSMKSRWENGSDIVGSLPDSVVKAYYKDIVNHDPVWDKLPDIQAPLLTSDLSGGQGVYAETFWKKHGIASRAYIPMPSKSNKYWFHYFGLFHKLPADEFAQLYTKMGEWLVPILMRYHTLLQVVAEKEQNPFKRQELLSGTCLQILKMTAQGMPVKSIADRLALTEEGITYHITRAKRVFGARNKTQLIAMMYEVGLL